MGGCSVDRPRMTKRTGCVGAGMLLLTVLVPESAGAAACQELTGVVLPYTTVTLAESITPGTFRPPASGRGRGSGAASAPFSELPEFCRVVAIAKPTAKSAITIEIWLPAAGWNGK